MLKKNILDLFFEKVMAVPFWIKQYMYLKLSKEMQEMAYENFMRNNPDELVATYVPTITFKGKTELMEHRCGFDNNIYNFLQNCANGYNMLEIAVNSFLSMEEVAKYYEICLEQNFIKNPESKEIHAMVGFIAGKFRTGEYFKQKGVLTVDQLQQAILAHRDAQQSNSPKRFGEIQEEAKKRFILDYNTVPKAEVTYSNENQKYEEEIKNLKDENLKLKRKLLQLLELVKKNSSH